MKLKHKTKFLLERQQDILALNNFGGTVERVPAPTRRLILLGPPGAGKGTQATFLAEKFKIPHISTGKIVRQAIAYQTSFGVRAQSHLEAGELVPDHLILALMRERLAKQDALVGWVVDGFPRNLAQAQALKRMLRILGQSSPLVVNLKVEPESLMSRMLQRGRQDDRHQTIRRRLKVYQEQTSPLINFYQHHGCLLQLDGNLPVAEVTRSLEKALSPESAMTR